MKVLTVKVLTVEVLNVEVLNVEVLNVEVLNVEVLIVEVLNVWVPSKGSANWPQYTFCPRVGPISAVGCTRDWSEPHHLSTSQYDSPPVHISV